VKLTAFTNLQFEHGLEWLEFHCGLFGVSFETWVRYYDRSHDWIYDEKNFRSCV